METHVAPEIEIEDSAVETQHTTAAAAAATQIALCATAKKRRRDESERTFDSPLHKKQYSSMSVCSEFHCADFVVGVFLGEGLYTYLAGMC